MTDETTVSPTQPTPAKAQPGEPALKHEPPKRKKTWGENVFNWLTYGGIALLGNEAASFVITDATKEGKAGHGLYSKIEAQFSKLAGVFKASDKPHLGEYIYGNPKRLIEIEGELKPLKPRLPYLLAATIGGMFMVPLVKAMEDHKGSIVRKFDRKHYGALTDNDPKLIEAHKEMDEAPKQNWSSLLKGRFTTVIAAAVADFTFGWDYALTTKLHPKASLNGLATMTADGSARIFKPKNEKVFKEVVGNGTWLLLLSSTLTVLFYASSKLFAKKREEKIERKMQRVMNAQGVYVDVPADEHAPDAPQLDSAQPQKRETPEQPTAQVKAVTREDTLMPPPQLSQEMRA